MERKRKESSKTVCNSDEKNWQLYLMALPAMVLLFCFAYMPMGGLVIAFKRYNFKDGIWEAHGSTQSSKILRFCLRTIQQHFRQFEIRFC